MNFIKIILAALALILAAWLAFSVIGIIYSALWYLFLLGIVAVGGTVGYKFLMRNKEPQKLKENQPTVIAEMQNADRALEEYKRKHLLK